MRTDYLLKLADVMDRVPAKSLWMASWQKTPATKPETGVLGECGFAGCACGWAVHEKIVPGLEIVEGHSPYNSNIHFWELSFGEQKSFSAASEAFELTEEQASYLFDPESYPNADHVKPHEVSFRLRHIAGGGEIKQVSVSMDDGYFNHYLGPNVDKD